MRFITARNSSCGKVIFSQVSLNLFMAVGWVPLVPYPFRGWVSLVTGPFGGSGYVNGAPDMVTGILQDTVRNEAVRILLECCLVLVEFKS